MLAYLFWHWPQDVAGYEQRLVDFHRQLGATVVPGFRESATYRVSSLPWIPAETGYEDWYLVDDFTALGVLNEAAVSAGLRGAHDPIAQSAAAGIGGLYAVRTGSPDLDARTLCWLSKPRGMAYPEFYATAPQTPCLLRRQLVLGPAPEFCAMSETPGGLQERRERLY